MIHDIEVVVIACLLRRKSISKVCRGRGDNKRFCKRGSLLSRGYYQRGAIINIKSCRDIGDNKRFQKRGSQKILFVVCIKRENCISIKTNIHEYRGYILKDSQKYQHLIALIRTVSDEKN